MCLLILLLAAVGYLALQNKFSAAFRPKLFPALFIGLTSALFTIWFGLKSESIDRRFTSSVFFHKTDKKPLDEHYQDHHKYGGRQFDGRLPGLISSHLTRDQGLKKALSSEGTKAIEEFYQNMLFVKLFSRFFWMYADWWDVRVMSIRRGEALESLVSPVEGNSGYDSLRWEDFLATLEEEDDLHRLLKDFSESYILKKMTVPPKTDLKITTATNEWTFKLINPFSEVAISVYYRGASTGLGDYKWLLGYDERKSEEYYSAHFEVSCVARFEKTRSLHPEMKKYRRWAETMFAEVQYQLDDEKRLERAHDYRDLVGP